MAAEFKIMVKRGSEVEKMAINLGRVMINKDRDMKERERELKKREGELERRESELKKRESEFEMRESKLDKRENDLKKMERILRKIENDSLEKSKTEPLDSSTNVWREIQRRKKEETKKKKSKICVVCEKPSNRYCTQCKISHYCSTECQRIDWKKRHKDECMLMWSKCPTPMSSHSD